jgi:hypothetical protein
MDKFILEQYEREMREEDIKLAGKKMKKIKKEMKKNK